MCIQEARLQEQSEVKLRGILKVLWIRTAWYRWHGATVGVALEWYHYRHGTAGLQFLYQSVMLPVRRLCVQCGSRKDFFNRVDVELVQVSEVVKARSLLSYR